MSKAKFKKLRYRIVSNPSWQVQVYRESGEWLTVAYCSSEASAQKALAKRKAFKGYKSLHEILRV